MRACVRSVVECSGASVFVLALSRLPSPPCRAPISCSCANMGANVRLEIDTASRVNQSGMDVGWFVREHDEW